MLSRRAPVNGVALDRFNIKVRIAVLQDPLPELFAQLRYVFSSPWYYVDSQPMESFLNHLKLLCNIRAKQVFPKEASAY